MTGRPMVLAPFRAKPLLHGPRIRRALSRVMIQIALLLLVAIALIPLIYMVGTSLKPDGTEYSPQLLPDRPDWNNYLRAFTLVPTLRFFGNTITIAAFSLAGELITSSLAAYAFARLRFPGRDALFVIVLSTMMLPEFVTLIPLFVLYRTLGWIDTFLPLIVPAFFGGKALFIFFLRQFFMTLPRELDDAAKIDGASFLRTWWSVILPQAKPALATVAVLSLVFHWNEYVGPLVYLNTQTNFTLVLGTQLFRDEYHTFFNLTMAYCTIITVPVLILFFIAQRHFVKGISMTGLAGR